MNWVLDNPTRFFQERDTLNKLEKKADWLTTAWRINAELVAVDFSMDIHGNIYSGRMTYPDMFPYSPPYIRPRDSSELWSGHQYGAGGSLCLQWRADNWQINITGADMIVSAYELLSAEKDPDQPIPVPSAHEQTQGQSMRGIWWRFVATNELIKTWLALPQQAKSPLKTTSIYSTKTLITYVTKVINSEDTEHDISDLPAGLYTSFSLLSVPGYGWIFKSHSFTKKTSIRTCGDLFGALTDAGFSIDDIVTQEKDNNKHTLVALLGSDIESLQVFSVKPEDDSLSELGVVLPTPAESRLPEEHKQLSKICVGIVGLGSVGSKVAISLARTGVRQFLLIDDDYLKPENLVRHELSWMYAGLHKVDAVREALTLTAPNIKVDTINTRIAGQESPLNSASALKSLSNCDCIVDATANPEAFLLLAAISEKYNKPLCWGEVYATGFGGLIARARPNHDPNPIATRDAIYSYLHDLPPAPYQNAQGYDLGRETPLIASDSDVGVISTALTRLTIDTVLDRNPSIFPYSVYRIGMREKWDFKEPFDTRPIDVQGRGWNSEKESVSEKDQLEALKTLRTILQETSNADTENPT